MKIQRFRFNSEGDQSNRGNMRRESGGDRYRGFSSGRGSKWRYQALPSLIRIGKRKRWKEKCPQHERESMVTRSDVPGTEEELKLGIVNTTDHTYGLSQGNALGTLLAVPILTTRMAFRRAGRLLRRSPTYIPVRKRLHQPEPNRHQPSNFRRDSRTS